MKVSILASTLLSFTSLVLAKSTTREQETSQNILPSDFTPPAVFQNTNLVRTIDLSKSYEKVVVNVVIENLSKQPQAEYYVPFTRSEAERLSGGLEGVEVRDRKESEKGRFEVLGVSVDPSSTTEFLKVSLPQPLAPKAQQTLAITYHLLHNLTPQPAAITQSEQQFVRADLSAYWPSAYDTLKQKTEVKLGSAGIKEYTKLPSGTSESTAELPTKAGSKLTYGPFGKVPAGAKEDVSVRYEYTKPLIHVTHLERDVEVSHWGGNIAFEERFLDLYNTAANLSKPFNRVEWAAAAFYKPSSTAVRDLTFSLPPGAKDPYFTDVIGNVSTSRFRPGHKSRDSVLEVKPRYPLFGGWKYPFTVGWNVDAGAFLKSLSSNKFILSVPFLDGPKQAEGVSYGEITLRVILPEGAKNIIWESEVVVASAEIVLHQTFMDTLGRTTLVLTVRNAVDEWRGRRVVVAYQYGVLDALRKPFVFFGGALSLFVAWWVLGSVNTGITAGRVVKGTKLKE